MRLMEEAKRFLPDSPVKQRRQQRREETGQCHLALGTGESPLPSSHDRAIRSQGLGHLRGGLDEGDWLLCRAGDHDVPGATGYLDTNYAGKAESALREISRKDLVYVHLEAPDEASHNGNLKDKIQAIEDFDHKIVGPILRGSKAISRIFVLWFCRTIPRRSG